MSAIKSNNKATLEATLPARRPRRSAADKAAAPSDPMWYKNAIIYELHVRSFADSTGDGIGDFNGLIEKLDYLQDMGITAIWLLPFYPSPLRDDGYDIADYLSVNPSYGTFADAQRFIKEAHRRGLKVITELVVNHTSDQHPWFQRARKAPAGSKLRDFYVWSDKPDRYSSTRIIFKDYETSNWAWDPVAKQYYWHRFFSHQPDLNFDNPAVHEAVLKVCDHWLDAGVDGMRLDAIPYLYERENTNCENLPETHGFLRDIRAHVDEKYPGRMLLGEANQWPEDAIAYFGDGDECHMAFHFPLMPRLFMAIRMEDRFPIIDILEQTPAIPEACQWALFLRNHDELTLEMVTDEERDYMYRVYAGDQEARINLGIRRRLAPLLGNNRRKIELMNALLFSLPGTPVIYYGDEIGMGDNVYLGDRDGVRTPMQWSGDRNAGFSKAGPQRLFLPVIIDPEYHYETVNVESQLSNPSSFLWWMKRLISLRKRHPVFGSGQIEFLAPSNPKVLAYVRTSAEETILVVANLSRFVQPTSIDLSKFKGQAPVEMFGQTEFPAITDQPYFLTMGPHSFYWFVFKAPAADGPSAGVQAPATTPTLRMSGEPGDWMQTKEGRTALEPVLSADIQHRRWFVAKAKTFRNLKIVDAVPIRAQAAADQPAAVLLLAQVEFADHEAETYAVPVAVCAASETARVLEQRPGAAIANLHDSDGHEWMLFDAMSGTELPRLLLESMAKGRAHQGPKGGLLAAKSKAFGSASAAKALAVKIGSAEQSNSSAIFGDRFIMKLFRRIESGTNPDLEIARHLTEQVGFTNTPPLAGWMEYRHGDEEARTLAVLHGFVPNQGDVWQYALDQFAHFFERALAMDETRSKAMRDTTAATTHAAAEAAMPGPWAEALGDFSRAVELLGRRTAEMHAALADDRGDAAFTPEPYTQLYQRGLAQSMRNTTRRTVQEVRKKLDKLAPEIKEHAAAFVGQEAEAIAYFRSISTLSIPSVRIRCHGDYHLGQVLWTGKDFIIVDFEGEPLRSLGERRLKRSPLRDTAGMLRSFQYAACTGLRRYVEGGGTPSDAADELARGWEVALSGAFLRSYITTARSLMPNLLPEDPKVLRGVLNGCLLEKALYEVSYELNSRPDWAGIPIRAVRQILASGV